MATSKFRPTEIPDQVSADLREYLDRTLTEMSVLLDGAANYIDDETIAHTDDDETITGSWTFNNPVTIDAAATLNGMVTTGDTVRIGFSASRYLDISYAANILNFAGTDINRLDIENVGIVDFQDSTIRIRNAVEGSDYIQLEHDGTNFNADLTNTTLMHWTGVNGGYLHDGGEYLSFRPDGAAAQNPGLTYTTADHAISLASTTDGDSLAFTLYNQDGSSNPRAAFFMDDTLNEYGLCQTWSSGAQLRFVIASAGSAELVGDWGSNLFYTRNGNKFRVYDSGNTDYVELYHNGTDAYMNGVNANWLRIGNLGSGILTLNGPEQRWYDSDNSDSIKLVHNGSHGHLMLGNKSGDDNGIVVFPETGGPNRSGFFVATRGFADEATGTYALPNSRDGGFVWIVASSTGSAEGVEGAHFYFTGTTMVDLGSGSNFSLGSGSNPNVDGRSNVWRSSAGILSIKNRRGAFRYYSIYCMFGD